MEDDLNRRNLTPSWPGLSRPSTPLPAATPQGVDARHKAGHDSKEETIPANPYVLQELAKEPYEREHEIISRRRRDLVKPHGYPLSGRDGAGRSVLFHSGEKEIAGAG
jgi:hypothetical protein